jgi:hypothetical protein
VVKIPGVSHAERGVIKALLNTPPKLAAATDPAAI